MRSFEIIKDPYDEYELFDKNTVSIKSGLTVLVGCNGSGKTTLLQMIEDKLKSTETPYISFNNYIDGGSTSLNRALNVDGDLRTLATLATSSEGERIVVNLGNQARVIGAFVRKQESLKNNPKELWVILDAIDSGLSIDNIIDVKEYLFKTIIKHNPDKEVYIVVSANTYELCRNEQCLDVQHCEYITFKDYDDYRDFILRSKEIKEKGFKKK